MFVFSFPLVMLYSIVAGQIDMIVLLKKQHLFRFCWGICGILHGSRWGSDVARLRRQSNPKQMQSAPITAPLGQVPDAICSALREDLFIILFCSPYVDPYNNQFIKSVCGDPPSPSPSLPLSPPHPQLPSVTRAGAAKAPCDVIGSVAVGHRSGRDC